MRDQEITFKTAELLKTKGFDRFKLQESTKLPGYGEHWPIVTQSFVQRWLREVHEIMVYPLPVIDIAFESTKWSFAILQQQTDETAILDYKSYEDALEAGIQEALLKLNDQLPTV